MTTEEPTGFDALCDAYEVRARPPGPSSWDGCQPGPSSWNGWSAGGWPMRNRALRN